jgi:hypothetical protein
MDNIIRLAQALQRVRDAYRKPMNITSWIIPTSVNPGKIDTSGGTRVIISDEYARTGDGIYAKKANYYAITGSNAGDAARSRHNGGLAVDISDESGALTNFLLKNQQLLEANGLWMEDERVAKTRVHLDMESAIIAARPRSHERRRIFWPGSDPEPEFKTGGYKYKNEAVRLSCQELSPAGKQILSALDEIGKELSITITVTDGNRSWQEQLSIVLKAMNEDDEKNKYPKRYSGTRDAYQKEFEGQPLPKTLAELSQDQTTTKDGKTKWDWFKDRILSQAGRPNATDRTPGFSHVGKDGAGGNAVDIRVSDIQSLETKTKLSEMLTEKGIGVLREKPGIYDSPPNNPVSISAAEDFHLSK